MSMDPIFAPGFFDGQVFIVTGGGTGIGRAVALNAGKLGAKVAICGRRIEPLKETANELSKLGAESYYESCDIRDEERVQAFVKNVLSKFGRIDVLINNAGGQFITLAEHVSLKGFTAVIRENLIGSWIMTQTVAKLAMIPQRSGSIVNVIAQVRNGFPGMVHTGAARAGIKNFTKTIAIEWGSYGIRANAVAPGVIRTEGTDKYPVEFLNRAAELAPLKRLGTPQDCANIILFLASNRASGFITGKTVDIDGGWSYMDARVSNLNAKL